MVSIVKLYCIIGYSIAIVYSSFGTGSLVPSEPYSFDVEVVDTLTFAANPKKVSIKGLKFNLPNDEAYRKLCVAAKEHALLDGMSPMDIISKPWPGHIRSVDMHWTKEYNDTLSCDTIPRVYLRPGKSIHDIIIMEMNSQYLSQKSCKFDVKIVASEPKHCSLDDLENSDLYVQDLRKYSASGIETLHICMNAKKHVGLQLGKSVVLTNQEVDHRKVWEFEYLDRSKGKHCAFKCRSEPSMYAYFGESEFDINVVLVDENAKPEPGHDDTFAD